MSRTATRVALSFAALTVLVVLGTALSVKEAHRRLHTLPPRWKPVTIGMTRERVHAALGKPTFDLGALKGFDNYVEPEGDLCGNRYFIVSYEPLNAEPTEEALKHQKVTSVSARCTNPLQLGVLVASKLSAPLFIDAEHPSSITVD